MALIWTKEYTAGDASIDQQHQELFRKISALEESVARGEAEANIISFLDFLKEYADYHFHYEERYMEAHKYPRSEEHKAAHQGFVKRLNEIIAKSMGPGKGSVVTDLFEFIEDWLKNHILTVDRDYMKYIDDHKKSHPPYETTDYHQVIH